MSQSVRAPAEKIWVVGRYVDEGQPITPGEPTVEIAYASGMHETLRAEDFGVVAHVEGKRINVGEALSDGDPHNDSGASMFDEHSVLCHIVGRRDRNSIKGGAPHLSTSRAISNAKAVGALLPTYG